MSDHQRIGGGQPSYLTFPWAAYALATENGTPSGDAPEAAAAEVPDAKPLGERLKFDEKELETLINTRHTSLSFQWKLLVVLLFPVLFIVAGLVHAAVDRGALAAGASISDLGINGSETLVLLPALLLVIVLQIWAMHTRRAPLLLPRHMSVLVNAEAQTKNIVAWFLRSGRHQYALYCAVVILCCILSLLTPATIVACQQAVVLPPPGAGLPSARCLTAAFQLPAQFEDADCQPCADTALYFTNTALYSTLGAAVVYPLVLAIAPSAKTLEDAKNRLKELQKRYPYGNIMVIRSEEHAAEKLRTYDEEQGKTRKRVKRIVFLVISLAVFLLALGGAVIRNVEAKLDRYPSLPLNLGVPQLWFTVVLSMLVILLALVPVTDLVIYVVPSCISQYVEPQVIYFTAYVNPTVRLKLARLLNVPAARARAGEPADATPLAASSSGPAAQWAPASAASVVADGLPSLPASYQLPVVPSAPAGSQAEARYQYGGGDSAEPLLTANAATLRRRRGTADLERTNSFGFMLSLDDVPAPPDGHSEVGGLRVVVELEGGRSIECPVDRTADAIEVILASEYYLYNWVEARRYQQRAVLNCTLAPVALLIIVIFVMGLLLFLAVLTLFLIPNNFQLSAVFHPAALLSLYSSLYALVSSTLVAVILIRLVDQTDYQVRARARALPSAACVAGGRAGRLDR